jgi:beta-lactam-binding protein with PASTA domain
VVLAQDPPGKAQGIERPSINLLLAAPGDDAADGFVMPDLTGLPVLTAQAQLAKVGIKAAPPAFVYAPISPVSSGGAMPTLPTQPGAVTAQQPPAGSRVDQATLVKLTVAK